MRLDLQTDFALRSLMFLGMQSSRARVSDIAEYFRISRPHVAKVVNQLARLGYIRSIRGVGGGIELARDPKTVSVGEVIRAFEGRTNLLDCVSIDNVCSIQSWCQLRSVMGQAERIQMDYLDGVMLADVLPGRPANVQLDTTLPSSPPPAADRVAKTAKRSGNTSK